VRLPAALALALCLAAPARAAEPPASAFDHEHLAWQRLLEEAVRDGLVDYEALNARPEPLEDYLHALASVSAGEYTAWTPDQRLAFWLDAVNAFTVMAVVDSYPLKRPWWKLGGKWPANSVKQVKDFERRTFTAAGQEVTLAEARALALQLRPDPRVALALTCPCQGGPPLPPQAFTAEAVDAQLDAAARAFLSDPKRVAIADERAQVVRLSEALRRKEIGDPLALARRYLKPEPAAALAEPGWTVEWVPLDWSLDELGSREAGRGAPKVLSAPIPTE
jgi:hypothetical protein